MIDDNVFSINIITERGWYVVIRICMLLDKFGSAADAFTYIFLAGHYRQVLLKELRRLWPPGSRVRPESCGDMKGTNIIVLVDRKISG